MSETVELRPFPPFLPPQARVIMMGSFPPAQEKRAMDFHYPNFNNDMWRVYGLIFFNDKDHFRKDGEKSFDAEKIKAFLSAKRIASFPPVALLTYDWRVVALCTLPALFIGMRFTASEFPTYSLLFGRGPRRRRERRKTQ